jgi:hypothetical protein
MKPASAFAVLLFSLFTVQSASAAVIGVRGVGSGSPPASDGAAYELTACDYTELASYYCAVYENHLNDEIYALDLAFWDAEGNPVPAVIWIGEFYLLDFGVAEASDFQLIRHFLDFQDEYLVRLCTDMSDAGVEACNGDFGEDSPIPAGSSFAVFADFPGFVSIQGVNEGENLNAATRGEPIDVPEPATLLLLGLGLATAAGRRLRHRRG